MRPISIVAIFIFAVSCSQKDAGFEAMGHFEADEYMLVAESGGRIIQLNLDEGDKVRKGDTVALTDTIALYLQLQQSKAQETAVDSKIPGIRAQEKVVATEISVLNSEKKRFSNLVDDKATSGKSLDDILHQLELAKARYGTFSSQINSLLSERGVIAAQQNIIIDQIRKCRVISPSDGVVINLIAKESDLMIPGKPLLKLADVDQI
ncbi:MAG: hypothetical protein WCW62_08145, partial [Bacteroidales bacterium]